MARGGGGGRYVKPGSKGVHMMQATQIFAYVTRFGKQGRMLKKMCNALSLLCRLVFGDIITAVNGKRTK